MALYSKREGRVLIRIWSLISYRGCWVDEGGVGGIVLIVGEVGWSA